MILITGATGFVGKSLVRRLLADDESRQLVITLRKILQPWPERVKPILTGELNHTTDWSIALEGVAVVVHSAARAHVMHETKADPLTAFRAVNVCGTLNLAYQAAAAGVKRFVFISSIGVNGSHTMSGIPFHEAVRNKPHNAYALSKWEAEQGLMEIAAETKLKVVIIRPPLVYGYKAPGNFGSLTRAVRLGWPLPLGAVHNQRSFIALDNLVDFIVTCTTHPQAVNQIFLVSDGQDLSTTELLRGMAQAAGVPVRLLPVPVWALQAGASLLGKSDAVQRLCGNLQIDISKARRLLDWAPPVSVEEGLRRAMAL